MSIKFKLSANLFFEHLDFDKSTNELKIDKNIAGTISRTKKLKSSRDIAKHNLQVWLLNFFWDNDYLTNNIIEDIERVDPTSKKSNINYSIESELFKLGEKRTIDEIYEYLFIGYDGEFDDLGKDDIEVFDVSSDVFEWAKVAHGVTENLNEAGYILPDGSLLDFSGRREGSKSFGSRNMDHRQIYIPIVGGISGTDLMLSFIRMGGIRCDFKSNIFHIGKEPTIYQLTVLRKNIREGAIIDLMHPNGNTDNIEVKNINNAINKIKLFYRG